MARGRLTEASIAAVRDTARIDTVVSQYVTLKRAGTSLKGLCPFHDEKGPSFHVTPDRGYWHCFGCSLGGDVIDFISRIENLDFIDAVERLAEQFRVELVYEDNGTFNNNRANNEPQVNRRRLTAANTAAADFYASQLFTPQAVDARRFLSDRGFDRHAAAEFGCGYSPNTWDALIQHLTGAGFTAEEQKVAGLTSDGKNGPVDRFRGRLMFPIRDQSGNVIGFGARKLVSDDQDKGPKYLNTPETPIYKKSRVLFGLDKARKSISTQRRVVVVEGYTDVMACHLSGEDTAVATCGTAFGEEHIRIIRRLLGDDGSGGEVIYTFDGDAAGQKAALRAFTMDDHFQTRTSVAVEPDGLDPCEVRMQHGPDGVQALLRDRIPLFEFAIKSTLSQFDLTTPEGRANALGRTAPILANIKHVEMRDGYIRQVSRWTGTDQNTIRRAVLTADPRALPGKEDTAPTAPNPGDSATGPNQPAPASGDAPANEDPFTRPDPAATTFLRETRNALKVLIQDPKFMQLARSELKRTDFIHPSYRAVWDAMVAADDDAQDKAHWVHEVHRHCPSPTITTLVTELAVEPVTDGSGPDRDRALMAFLGAVIEAATYATDRIERTIDSPDLPDEQYLTLLERLTAINHRQSLAQERRNQLLIG